MSLHSNGIANGQAKARLHIAIIMDGNGRWAKARGLPRSAGHLAGVNAVRATVEAAARRQIGTLTLYAFSSDNWQRPRAEVRGIMQLLTTNLPVESRKLAAEGIRMSVIGRRDRFDRDVVRAIERAEERTRLGGALHLRLALDYSSRTALAQMAKHLNGDPTPCHDAVQRALARAYQTDTLLPDVDLLIRTGGEQRLSDFLLWESAYAELYFTACRWPDFDAEALDEALEAFEARQRRFGKVLA